MSLLLRPIPPESYIFLDVISFIIHQSTAPLISSLSAAHSSHFLSTSATSSLMVGLSYICDVPAAPALLASGPLIINRTRVLVFVLP